MRSGTLNVPAIVGFGRGGGDRAPRRCRKNRAGSVGLRERLRQGIEARVVGYLRERLDGAPAARQPEHQLCLRRGRSDADGAEGRRGVVAARPALRRRWSPPTSCGRWASRKKWRTPRFASASAGSTPTKRSTTSSTWWSRKVDKLREMSPALRDGQGRHRPQVHRLGRALDVPT